jgi:glycerate dehydrogenase
MRIVILNESYLDASHLERLAKLGDVVTHTDTATGAQLLERSAGADIVIADSRRVPLDAKFFEQATGLGLLAINMTGFDLVDIESARANGVDVANVPSYCADSVAERAIALMFALCHQLKMSDTAMQVQSFETDAANAGHQKYKWREVTKQTVGIIGMGATGDRIADLALGLGMRVVATDIIAITHVDVESLSLADLAHEADVICLALPANASTHHIVSTEFLDACKHGVVIVNTARGALVDDQAMATALDSGRVASFAADTISDFSDANPLRGRSNVVLTPHNAFFTDASLRNGAEIITTNIESWVAGRPINIVNA